MRLTIIQKKQLTENTWYMCVGNLFDYLSTLHKDFYEYQIQRRIVRNIYLDKLYGSIIKGEPLPPITLNSRTQFEGNLFSDVDVDMAQCDVLDGLQRTFRLWIIIEIYNIISEHKFQNYKSLRSWLRQDTERGSMIISQDFVNTRFLKSLFEGDGIELIIESYKRYDVTLSIWTGLTDDDIIDKMLVLNAGQRAVSSTHQYELLFLHFFDTKKLDFDNIKLYRERDTEYYKVRSGKRIIGEYSLSSIIVAIQSLIDKKPYRVSPANFITVDDNSEQNQENLAHYFNTFFLRSFIERVFELDKVLCKKDERFLSWYGKDTTLSGIYASIGKFTEEGIDPLSVIDMFISSIETGKFCYDIDGFNEEYSKLSSVKVNLGNEIRQAIFRYTNQLLSSDTTSDWKIAFHPEK